MKKLLFISLFGLLGVYTLAQSGCTDPNAINYDPNAQTNDGSCLYEPLVLNPEILIENLPSQVEETSGLIWFNDALWTHNDSGGQACVYKLDPQNGEIIQTVTIDNGNNVDFEDITQDNTHIFIGDMGNNYGDREDLKIYKIKKADITDEIECHLEAELITFSYKDQKSYEGKNRNNNFDCESLISKGEHLYLFTKNWVDQETKCYKLGKESGNYELDILHQFNVRGLLTGADYNEETNQLILIGYENFIPFTWLIWDFEQDEFFSGNKRRVDFAYIQGAQTEGICFKDNTGEILISCEASFYPPGLYGINIEDITTLTESESFKPFDIKLFPVPADNNVFVSITGLTKPDFDVEIYNLSWERIRQFSYREKNFEAEVQIQFSTNQLSKGIYFVRVKQGRKIGFKKLIINK